MCFVTLVKLFDLLNYTLGNEKSLFRLNYEHKNERLILLKKLYIFLFLYFLFYRFIAIIILLSSLLSALRFDVFAAIFSYICKVRVLKYICVNY